jgi:hypothetical protein
MRNPPALPFYQDTLEQGPACCNGALAQGKDSIAATSNHQFSTAMAPICCESASPAQAFCAFWSAIERSMAVFLLSIRPARKPHLGSNVRIPEHGLWDDPSLSK